MMKDSSKSMKSATKLLVDEQYREIRSLRVCQNCINFKQQDWAKIILGFEIGVDGLELNFVISTRSFRWG